MTTRPSPFFKNKKVKPKRISTDRGDLVKTGVLTEGQRLPLVVEPAVADLDPVQWVAASKTWIEAALAKHGAVLFRGFELESLAAFEAFAGAICPSLYGEYGDLPHAEGKVYDVTPYPPEGTILFHNESSHMHRWPMRQFFFCLVPAKEGGETPIVDCREIYRALDPGLIQVFREKKLRYVRNFIAGVDVSWRDFFKTEDKRRVETLCQEQGIHFNWKGDDLETHQLAPAIVKHPRTGEWVFFNQIQLHHIGFLEPEMRKAMLNLFSVEDLPRNVVFGDGTVIEDEVAKLIERLYWEKSVAFSWRSGDVLLVDNMLTAHARNPYQPPRKMFVSMGDIVHQRDMAEA